MKYEKARFVNNIYELARKQKMKIGDLEFDTDDPGRYIRKRTSPPALIS